MKKINLFLLASIMILAFISCGGPEKDAKKKMKLMKEFNESVADANKDSKIDEKELKEITEIQKEMEEFAEEIAVKYKNDTVSLKLIEDIEGNEEHQKIWTEYINSLIILEKSQM
jgi:predicted GTPase